MTEVSEAEVEAAAKAIYEAEFDPGSYPWDKTTSTEKEIYRHMARAALTASAQVRAQAARANCKHPRKTGTGFVRSDGSSHSKWACPDCGSSGEFIGKAIKPTLMPIYGATEDKEG